MSLGPASAVVNGQLQDFPQMGAYAPFAFGPSTVGVPNVSPSLPPYAGGGAPAMGIAGAGGNVGGYGTAANNTLAAGIANANPWNPRVSPVWWAIVGLIVSLWLLKAVHWRETMLEGHEEGRVGEAREEAEAEA